MPNPWDPFKEYQSLLDAQRKLFFDPLEQIRAQENALRAVTQPVPPEISSYLQNQNRLLRLAETFTPIAEAQAAVTAAQPFYSIWESSAKAQEQIRRMIEPLDAIKNSIRGLDDWHRNELASMQQTMAVFSRANLHIQQALQAGGLTAPNQFAFDVQAIVRAADFEKSLLIELAAGVADATSGEAVDEGVLSEALERFVAALVAYLTKFVTDPAISIALVSAVFAALVYLSNPNEKLELRIEELTTLLERSALQVRVQVVRLRATANVNLRLRPDVGSKVLDVLPAGQMVELISRKGDWVFVSVTGERAFVGYVRQDYLEPIGSQ